LGAAQQKEANTNQDGDFTKGIPWFQIQSNQEGNFDIKKIKTVFFCQKIINMTVIAS